MGRGCQRHKVVIVMPETMSGNDVRLSAYGVESLTPGSEGKGVHF